MGSRFDSKQLTLPVFCTRALASRPRRKKHMPLFMDTHQHIEGLTAEGVEKAHRADLEKQGKHGVKYLRYWFNEATGSVFCLVEAPTKEAAMAVHKEAHGLLADEIVEVKEGR
jgi:hypothetical protein